MAHLGSLVLRSAREQDYPKLDHLFRKNAPLDQDRILYKILEQTEPSAIKVVTYGGQVIGCAYGHDHGEGVGVIGGLFIGKPFDRAQTAEALIQLCTERLRARSCSDIISMISEQDVFLETFYKLGFKDWQRKVWTFIELTDEIDSPKVSRIGTSAAGQEHIALTTAGQDLIPYRFWYRRVSQGLIRNAYDSGHAITEENNGKISFAIWEDLPALKIHQSKYSSYFLFDKACNELTEIGDPIQVREISFAHGPSIDSLIKGIMRDAYEMGVRVALLHCSVADAQRLANMNFRFSAPRIILRSQLGTCLDDFLNQARVAAGRDERTMKGPIDHEEELGQMNMQYPSFIVQGKQ